MQLIIFSGAGLSAESGIATFRDNANSLWNRFDPTVLAHYATWRQNFDRVHEFYNWRRSQLADVVPNAAHYAIADWQKRYETIVFTQNVDDLLERAGCSNVVHLHGKLVE